MPRFLVMLLLTACLLLPALAQAANSRTDSAYSPGITGTHPPLSHRNQDTLGTDKLHQAPHTPPDAYHDSGSVVPPPKAGNPDIAPHNSTYSRNVNPRTKANGPDAPYHDYNTTPKVKTPARAPSSYGNSGQGMGSSARPWRSY